ncbi:MAG: hypothetical protein P8163_04720 [Candidatus Thiodiazotropha sp.]
MNRNNDIIDQCQTLLSGAVFVATFVLVWFFGLPSVQAAELKPLADIDVVKLQVKLDEMKSLASPLRVQLRKVRSEVEFDIRQIHSIERSISQAENDLKRLIMMHRGGRFNGMRAHFLTDSLRRKARNLHGGEDYVDAMMSREQQKPDQQNAELLNDYNQLRSQLGNYSQLLDQCLVITTRQQQAL